MSNSYLSLVMVSASTSFFSSNATSSCMGKRNLILVFSYFIWDKSGYLSRTASNSTIDIFCTLIIPESTFDYHCSLFFSLRWKNMILTPQMRFLFLIILINYAPGDLQQLFQFSIINFDPTFSFVRRSINSIFTEPN